MASLLSIKFYFPPIPGGFVTRHQLFDKLDQALSHRLTLVSAPPGAGKTTTVSAWVQAGQKKGLSVGWLSLEEADNVPLRFLEYLSGCLEEGGALSGPSAPQPRSDEPPGEQQGWTELIQGLVKARQEVVVILDDYHLIHNPEIHRRLGYFLEHIPPRLHILLLTRSDPPLELARLRAAGHLLEVRMEHLRFSDQEAGSFLKQAAGVQMSEGDLETLNARTEGWIAGLQMAAISLRGRRDVSAFVAAFAGSHRFVFDYLLEQVLSRQTPEVRQFLLRTSMLEQLSAPLCEAVAETGGKAQQLLDSLERGNLFLRPLDDERSWYRYHHLFAELLKLVLEQEQPGMAADLHRRASCWYEAQGLIPEAFHHALPSGDMELAARLVSENVLALVEHAEVAPILLRLESTLDDQPHKTFQSGISPWLRVAQAWALAYTGQMERAKLVLSQAERRLQVLPGDEHNRIAGHIAAVRAYTAWVHGSQDEALRLAETAERFLPAGEITIRALNLTTLGNALVQDKANPQAVAVFEQATALAQQAGQSHVLMLSASALAYSLAALGRLHQAHAVCLEALQAAETYQRRHSRLLPAVASVYAVLAGILSKWGEVQASIQTARKGLALSEIWGQADATMLCLLHLADGLSLAHELEAAQDCIQRARSLARKVSPWFVWNVDASEIGLWLDADNPTQAARVAHAASLPAFPSLGARLLVKQNRLDEALSFLEQALAEARKEPSIECLRLEMIQALTLYLKKDQVQALTILKRVLEQAETENQVIEFVRQGPAMEKLLRRALARGMSPEFTRQLLAAFQEQRQPAILAGELFVEALSERELEVLKLLNSHLSVPEIAGELFVSANTVRTHIKNIYGKLGVHRRSTAVQRAHDLGLLP